MSTAKSDIRPRCRHRRTQDVRVRVPGRHLAFTTVRKSAPCGMLLDRTGKCWFCGHVDTEVRRAYRQSAMLGLQTPKTKGL